MYRLSISSMLLSLESKKWCCSLTTTRWVFPRNQTQITLHRRRPKSHEAPDLVEHTRTAV